MKLIAFLLFITIPTCVLSAQLNCYGYLRTFERDNTGKAYSYQDADISFPIDINYKKNTINVMRNILHIKSNKMTYVAQNKDMVLNLDRHTGKMLLTLTPGRKGNMIEAKCIKSKPKF